MDSGSVQSQFTPSRTISFVKLIWIDITWNVRYIEFNCLTFFVVLKNPENFNILMLVTFRERFVWIHSRHLNSVGQN